MQRDLHPTVLSSLEGIVDQMVWFRENWYEEVLRQLRQGMQIFLYLNYVQIGPTKTAPLLINPIEMRVL